MISVSIAINGVVIMARSAINSGIEDSEGRIAYRVDDGSSVWHNPNDGAVPLAIELLKKIKEVQK